MVLVTGPTGSGKTTTLYAALSEIKTLGRQDRHDRGPGRVPAARHHADSDQREEGADVRSRPAVDPAPRPRQDHGRRDPRPRDGADRHPVGADRPPGVHHRPRQQRRGRAGPLPEHGRRAVSVRVGAQLRDGAAPGAPHLRALQAADQASSRGCSRSRGSSPALAQIAPVLRRRRLHRVRRHRVQGPHGHLRTAEPVRSGSAR